MVIISTISDLDKRLFFSYTLRSTFDENSLLALAIIHLVRFGVLLTVTDTPAKSDVLFCRRAKSDVLFCRRAKSDVLFCRRAKSDLLFCRRAKSDALFCR